MVSFLLCVGGLEREKEGVRVSVSERVSVQVYQSVCGCVQACVKIGGNMVAKMIKQNRKNSNGGGVRKKYSVTHVSWFVNLCVCENV